MRVSDQRTKQRFCVNLNATYGIKGQGAQHHECQISTLSSSGATVRFPRTESLKSGAVIVMDITIPNTITIIAAEAEILWIKNGPNVLISGIKFTGKLSDTMFHQVVNNNLQLSDYTELFW